MGMGKKKSPQAAGQYLGYSLQQTLFLKLLLQAEKGYAVSLEVFEDIGVEGPSGKRLAVQAKSVLDGNPVSDRAVGLWKTLSNWIDAAKQGTLRPESSTYQIYVSQEKGGEIVEAFSQAESEAEARGAFAKAREKLWGTAPQYKLKQNVAETIKDYVQHVFDNEDLACKVIQSFTLVAGTGCSYDEVKPLMERVFVPGEIIELVIAYALGWVKLRTDAQLERNVPAVISYDVFHAELISYIRKAYRHQLLMSFAPAPKQHDIASHLRTLHNYVLQLEFIESDEEDKLRAISDYLWAASNRTKWSSMGLVNSSSFTEFEEDLKRTWKNLETQGRLLHSSRDDVAKGGLLYSECSKYEGRLEGLEVPTHFTPGSFHALADAPVLGWHPQYKDKLKAQKSKTSKRGEK
jgi:hypothetical protein